MANGVELKVFSGSGNRKLAEQVCEYLGIALGKAAIGKFPDGEKLVKLEDDVRGKDCYIIQSTCDPVDENLVELLIFLDCLKRASARRITAVIPYFGYARQDRKDEGRVPITAKLMANMISIAGAGRVVAIDLHAQQLQGFFDIPVDHLAGELVFREFFKKQKIKDLTIVSPDLGNTKESAKFAASLGVKVAMVHKERTSGSNVQAQYLIGDVKDRNVLLYDDMITTAGTICSAAELVKAKGAKDVWVCATHGIFAGEALERLKKSKIDKVVITDTVPVCEKTKQNINVTVLTVSSMLGEAIKRIHDDQSISCIFKENR